MSGLYLTWMVDVLRNAGCNVAESSVTNGWQTRARSSGGFPFMPLGIQWHHTASSTSPASDLSWMIDGSDDAPIGNVLLDRTGTYWPVAAGASNTAGKGGPLSLSRGTVPVDSANSQTFAIECANNGTGESWPTVQVDAYFRGSNALNIAMGNRPDDVFTHSLGEGNGWTNRKIDPATAAAVQGGWRPRSVSTSGTWSLTDIRTECNNRSGEPPPVPIPPPSGGDVADKYCVRAVDGMPWVTDFASYATQITEDQAARGRDMRGYIVASDGGPFPLDEQDSDLMMRLDK